MNVFVVTILVGDDTNDLIHRIVRESGIGNVAVSEKFFPDQIQDPYAAVDEVDALVWVHSDPPPSMGFGLGLSDYNYLFADTVMQRAVRTGKPILYYHLKRRTDSMPAPAILGEVTRRAIISTLQELEDILRKDLEDLAAGRIPRYNPAAPSIFLSYSHADKPFVRQLQHDLALSGARVWIDDGEIQIGDSLIEAIRRGIDESDYFGVVLSPESVNSRWVQKELDIAMNQEIDGQRVKVLPLVHRTCDLPGFLKGKSYADFSQDYSHALRQVLRRLGL